MANGFSYADCHKWSNLGQGAPEVGPIPNAPQRPTSFQMPEYSLEYAPTTGVKGVRADSRLSTSSYVAVSELRQAVANLYNHTYRQGKISQYTHENVCIVPGGRAGLSRVAAVVGDVFTVWSRLRSTFCFGTELLSAVVPSSGLHRLRSGVECLQEIGARSHRVSTAVALFVRSSLLIRPTV